MFIRVDQACQTYALDFEIDFSLFNYFVSIDELVVKTMRISIDRLVTSIPQKTVSKTHTSVKLFHMRLI